MLIHSKSCLIPLDNATLHLGTHCPEYPSSSKKPASAKAVNKKTLEPWYGISNNVVCATSKASDQLAHMRSLIRAFASCVNIVIGVKTD